MHNYLILLPLLLIVSIATEGSETLSAGTRTGASTLVFGSHVGTAVHLFTDGSNWYDIIQN